MLISEITDVFSVRKINSNFVDLLANDFKENGYESAYPVSITKDGVLWDGAHRLEACKKLEWKEIMHITETPENMRVSAHKRNAAGEKNLPTTFVDHAVEIWELLANGKTQQVVADEKGWSRASVLNYSRLNQIHEDVWNSIDTEIKKNIVTQVKATVSNNDTTVSFTEGLLRPIITLTPDNQHELVNNLINDKDFNKSKFAQMAAKYNGRDKAAVYVFERIARLGNEYLETALKAVDIGTYDKEWTTNRKTKNKSDPYFEPESTDDSQTPEIEKKLSYPKTDKLIQAQIDAYEEKNNIILIHGDFYKEIKNINDETIDAVITDPPYNISKDRIYTLNNQADWNKDFGEWDKQEDDTFISNMRTWAVEFFRVLKPGKTGFMFVGEKFLNIAQSIFKDEGFEIKGTFSWCRTNPGVSITKADFMPATDMAIQFVKPGKTRLFNYPGDPEGYNYKLSPICGGNERLKTSRNDALHPTQKPEAIISHLLELITDIGDKVLDGFMGVGTTPAVAKQFQRKCVGIEKEKQFFEAAQRRIANE